MSIYSVDKIMTEARRLAKEYREATGKTLPITGEIAINDAIQHLNLTPAEKDQTGYDAIMEHGDKSLRVQIKGRVIFDERKSGYRLGQLKIEQDWDGIIMVLMNKEFEPNEIYFAHREDIIEVVSKSKNKKGAISVARFKIIGDLLWSAVNGLEDMGYWSNL